MNPSKTGVRRILAASLNSMRGLRACWVNEVAFRQNFALVLALFILSFFVARSAEQWLLLILAPSLLLIVELLNSAIENAVDLFGPERNDFAGRAKDMASAAVLLCHVLIGLSWLAICWVNYLA